MTQRYDIAVLLVGMNTREFVRNFLCSLAKTDWQGYAHEILYVDNASKDETLRMLSTEFPSVKVISNRENIGFTRAANQAARAANSRYHLQINNDTLVFPESIALLARFLDNHSKVAMAGGRILNPDLSDQWSARRFPSARNAIFNRRALLRGRFTKSKAVSEYLYRDLIQGDAPFRVDWVPTVYSMIREEAYQEAGGMPENMYYWAESVFCLRLERLGYETWTVPASKIIHFEGHGGGPRSYRVKKWHIIDFHRGAYRFLVEQHKLARLSPLRLISAALLGARAALLLAANRLNHLGRSA